MSFDHAPTKRCISIVLAALSFIIFVMNLALITGTNIGLERPPITRKFKPPGSSNNQFPEFAPDPDDGDPNDENQIDNHPIAQLMNEASARFRAYDDSRSKSFAQAVKKYREKHGRHPPPGFDKWYRFARERDVYNIDDFDQIWDDIRPFWSILPMELRKTVKGMLKEGSSETGLAGIRIRHGKITIENGNWRTNEFKRMLEVFVKELPDMDIAMNTLDQPRVIVEWEQLQEHLKAEEENRALSGVVMNGFSRNREFDESMELPTAGWFGASGSPYMDLVSKACPPDSYARNSKTMDPRLAEAKYKFPNSGGLVSNFNTSSDLCTVGPAISELHGLLFAASTIIATKKLVPVFGECKVNVNNDILFPANMYYKDDSRYQYNPQNDRVWEDKKTTVLWRGITSGGTQTIHTWRRLHRHRLVQLANSSLLEGSHKTFSIPNFDWGSPDRNYAETPGWIASGFADRHLDIGFPELVWCVPDSKCGWLRAYLKEVPPTALTDQFLSKYLPDIDGHSFSGRWNAWMKSRSLGIKATIFREWHDSRLFAWHHFAPMDNRFDDLYSILTYFIGVGSPPPRITPKTGPKVMTGKPEFYIPSHDFEAKRLATQGRQWAAKVLRKEDMEVYMFRLMLEYARLMDDHRDLIGYGGSGEEMKEEPEWRW